MNWQCKTAFLQRKKILLSNDNEWEKSSGKKIAAHGRYKLLFNSVHELFNDWMQKDHKNPRCNRNQRKQVEEVTQGIRFFDDLDLST